MMRLNLALRRTRAYKAAFDQSTQHGKDALADLLKFCQHGRSLYRKDQRQTDILIGRQEVLMRILSALSISEQELHELYQSNFAE